MPGNRDTFGFVKAGSVETSHVGILYFIKVVRSNSKC